jgi:RHS repeat-associated protein
MFEGPIMNSIKKHIRSLAIILGLLSLSAFSQTITLTVGANRTYSTIMEALATIPQTLDADYVIEVDIPTSGYTEPGLDINSFSFAMGSYTLDISGVPVGDGQSNVTYYFGGDIEYRQTPSSVTTIENISGNGGIARRTHAAGYNDNAPYDLLINNHLGSTMVMIDENGEYVSNVYDYFPYGKEKVVASGPGAALPVTQTFTGKELDLVEGGDVTGEDGEGRYYFGKRYYDADVGVWTSIDRMKENWGPYTAFNNNPLFWVDPDGMKNTIYIVNQSQAKYVGSEEFNAGIKEYYPDFGIKYVDAIDPQKLDPSDLWIRLTDENKMKIPHDEVGFVIHQTPYSGRTTSDAAVHLGGVELKLAITVVVHELCHEIGLGDWYRVPEWRMTKGILPIDHKTKRYWTPEEMSMILDFMDSEVDATTRADQTLPVKK